VAEHKIFLKQDPEFPDAKLPERGSALASGLDVFAAKDVTIGGGDVGLVPSGWLLADLAPHLEIQVRSRSGNTLKRKFMVANQPGTVDADYRGHIGVIVYNFGREMLEIKKGEKVAQLVVCEVVRPPIEVVAETRDTDRGAKGFGSTGR
jgi:dUTP pyrophosphatase